MNTEHKNLDYSALSDDALQSLAALRPLVDPEGLIAALEARVALLEAENAMLSGIPGDYTNGALKHDG